MILQALSDENFHHPPQHLQSSPPTHPSSWREAGGSQDDHQLPTSLASRLRLHQPLCRCGQRHCGEPRELPVWRGQCHPPLPPR